MNYSELLQLAKGWSNLVSNRIIIWRLQFIVHEKSIKKTVPVVSPRNQELFFSLIVLYNFPVPFPLGTPLRSYRKLNFEETAIICYFISFWILQCTDFLMRKISMMSQMIQNQFGIFINAAYSF